MALIEIKQRLETRERLVFLLAWMTLFGGAAIWQGWRHDRTIVAIALALPAIGLPLASLVSPRAIDGAYRLLATLTWPIGWVVSHAALAVIWFGVITPIGCFRRLLGYDPMRRRFEPDRESYWEPISGRSDPRSYFDPF